MSWREDTPPRFRGLQVLLEQPGLDVRWMWVPEAGAVFLIACREAHSTGRWVARLYEQRSGRDAKRLAEATISSAPKCRAWALRKVEDLRTQLRQTDLATEAR